MVVLVLLEQTLTEKIVVNSTETVEEKRGRKEKTRLEEMTLASTKAGSQNVFSTREHQWSTTTTTRENPVKKTERNTKQYAGHRRQVSPHFQMRYTGCHLVVTLYPTLCHPVSHFRYKTFCSRRSDDQKSLDPLNTACACSSEPMEGQKVQKFRRGGLPQAFEISSEIGDKRNDVGDKGREHIRQLVVQGFDKIPKPGVFAFQPLNWSCHAHPWCQRRNSQTGENPFSNQETPFQKKRSEASITTQGTYNI